MVTDPLPLPITPAARSYLAGLAAAGTDQEQLLGLGALLVLVESQAMPAPEQLAQALGRTLAHNLGLVLPPGNALAYAERILGFIAGQRARWWEAQAKRLSTGGQAGGQNGAAPNDPGA